MYSWKALTIEESSINVLLFCDVEDILYRVGCIPQTPDTTLTYVGVVHSTCETAHEELHLKIRAEIFRVLKHCADNKLTPTGVENARIEVSGLATITKRVADELIELGFNPIALRYLPGNGFNRKPYATLLSGKLRRNNEVFDIPIL